MGFILCFLFALQMIASLLAKNRRPSELWQPLRMMASSSSWNAEYRVHRAARQKVGKILSNTLELHKFDGLEPGMSLKLSNNRRKQLSSTTDQTSRNFILRGHRYQASGGILWTFWKICDGSLFNEEGLWMSTRLVVIQIGQLVSGTFIIVFFFVQTERLAKRADEYRDSLAEDGYPNFIMDIFPTGAMVRGALFPASIVALIISAMIVLLHVPRQVFLQRRCQDNFKYSCTPVSLNSAMSTVLKYRCNLLPSLGSSYFEDYRVAVDLVSHDFQRLLPIHRNGIPPSLVYCYLHPHRPI